ncbi:hypothetical protein CBS147343_6958 [Aspergillus niger]|nr:hypothetical protein CBS11852_10862 [Aspergillus niger]KAI3067472.1 hypothetical protein CBS147343_6958 [Aspergillus niger]
MASPSPMKIIIVGGSLSALMQGITLHQQGHSIHILEQSPTPTPVSHMAGVSIGPDVQAFLSRFDRVSHIPLGIPATQLQSVDHSGQPKPFFRLQRIMTSWDALYFRLRANYDGLASDYIPNPPDPLSTLPDESSCDARARARYEYGQRVVDISEIPSTGQLAIVTESTSSSTRATTTYTADLVLGADGPRSTVRQLFLPPSPQGDNKTHRKYAGYLAWRAIIPESRITPTTLAIFQSNISYLIRKRPTHGSHIVVYHIPGPNGSITPGTRYLNFCWYENVPAHDLPTLMTDIHGVRHHTTVAPGLVPPRIWNLQRAQAAEDMLDFPAPFRELLSLIDAPFLHLITDYPPAERTCFLGGKVSEELRTHTKNSLLDNVAGLLRKNSRNPASTLIQEDRIGNSLSQSDTTVLTDANKRNRLGEQPRRGLDLSNGRPSLGVAPDVKGCEHRIFIQTSATVVWTDGIEKGAAGKSETCAYQVPRHVVA